MLSVPLLHLLRLVSPSLPIGGFAYSQGLEYAIDGQWVNNPEELKDWLLGVAGESLGRTDAGVIKRYYQALDAEDSTMFAYWNQWLRANRESQELLLEDEQLGSTLKRLLTSTEVLPGKVELPDKPGYSCLFALAAHHYQIPVEQAILGFLWSWLENQVAVACKTLPLGQTDAQKLILATLPELEAIALQAAAYNDDDLGGTLPGFALASALHETQYSRLFRS